MRRGWHGESYRHYLASKGVRSYYLLRPKRQVLPATGGNVLIGIPERKPFPYRQRVDEKLSGPKDESGIEHLDETTGTKVLKQRYGIRDANNNYVSLGGEVQYMNKEFKVVGLTSDTRQLILEGSDGMRVAANPYSVTVKSSKEVVPEKSKDLVQVGGITLRKKGAMPARFMAKKGFSETDEEEGAKEYVERNVRSEGKDGLHDFSKSVKRMVRHPMNDLDEEWQEYTRLADNKYYGPRGKAEPLSKDKVERTEQRGAALFGRVVSQANVEPLIDKEKDRSFRETWNDLMFGRRLD
jgi:hypothetical protein